MLTPNDDEQYFKEEFESDGVLVRHLEVERSTAYFSSSRLQQFLRQIRVFVLNGSGDITTIDDLYSNFRRERSANGILRRAKNAAFDWAVWALRRSRLLRTTLISLESRLFAGHFHSRLFDQYRPDMVVTPSLGYFRHDEYLMREAKRRGVPVVSVILSWDNTTSWGMAAAKTDYVIASTDLMRQELIGLHDLDPLQVFVEGVAYFDHYYRRESLPDRSTFFSEFGLDAQRRLILLATQSPTIFPWNPDLISMVARAVADGRLPEDCQLLVRLHPLHLRYDNGQPVYKDLLDEYDRVQREYPFVVFNRPAPLSTRLHADMPRSEMTDVACMLAYSDVLVNHYSTLAVESSLFDLPAINVGFAPGDLAKMTGPRQSATLPERRTHNQRVIQAGGVRTARAEEELIEYIGMYLSDRSIDTEGRSTVRLNESGPNPGQAGRHVGERLLQLLEQTSAASA